MKRSSFRHYNLNQSNRQTLTIKAFGGVDFTTPKFLVDSKRAIDLLNFVYKDGVIQKRNGLEERYRVKPYKYIAKSFDDNDTNIVQENDTNFNGLWKFLAEDGQEHFIAHIGKLLYTITNIDNEKIEFSPIVYSPYPVIGDDNLSYYQCYEFLNYSSSAFVGGNKLWFLGGNKYMCLRFLKDANNESIIQFFPVEDSDFTPIPTTTISITYKNSIANRRASLDKTNLLTMWRKNKLISGTSKNENEKTRTEFFEYTLDAPIVCKNTKKDMANFSVLIEERGTIE